MIGCLPTQALVFLAVFVYSTHATHATQAIAFEWKPGLRQAEDVTPNPPLFRLFASFCAREFIIFVFAISHSFSLSLRAANQSVPQITSAVYTSGSRRTAFTDLRRSFVLFMLESC